MNREKIETVFFDVLEDISDYLPDLTLVGGWMPYVYSNFLWKTSVKNPVITADIDFGVDQFTRNYTKTIFETLSSLNYRERHLKLNGMVPVVLYKGEIPVEFITYPRVDIQMVEKIVGQQIQINQIDKFDFLLSHRISLTIQVKKKNKSFLLNCPKPSAFLYHKGETFVDRENKEKQAKDLYYMYFILRYAPDIDKILEEVSQYKQKSNFTNIVDNVNGFFERVSSQGCLLIEQENGPDEYIENVRQDIFERFKGLRETLQKNIE